MSAAMTRASVGDLLTTEDELDALPAHSVLLADPQGLSPREDDRLLSMQKRPGDSGGMDFWFLAQDGMFSVLSSDEVVHRFHLGPFLVLWLPSVEPVIEAAA
ncbi:hypothetical protein [Arthrobacter sp. UYCu712]|uniref:hypothetical protein n=1 Tax=Arthrobacter sp. UYCu712 TaxID=3156340 RepID=UPI00339529E7